MQAGKEHRGYAANITETVDENGSVVTDYQYDTNNRSDIDFLEEYINKSEVQEESTALITDTAYAGDKISELAADKNFGLITTGLHGRKPREILNEFVLSEDELSVVSCPEGHATKSSS